MNSIYTDSALTCLCTTLVYESPCLLNSAIALVRHVEGCKLGPPAELDAAGKLFWKCGIADCA